MTDFESIYNAYFDDVFRYIFRLSNDKHIAEDITSNTFFKAMQSLKNFRGDCDIRVWLCQIAKNCYYSYIKSANRTISVDDTTLINIPDTEYSVEQQLLKQDQAMRIQNVLHGVPEPYKEVFMWRVFAELSFKQIGQIFNKSENWACVTYHRARNMIKERLEDTQNEK